MAMSLWITPMPRFMTCNTVTNLRDIWYGGFHSKRHKQYSSFLSMRSRRSGGDKDTRPRESVWDKHLQLKGTKEMWGKADFHAKTLLKRHELASPRPPPTHHHLHILRNNHCLLGVFMRAGGSEQGRLYTIARGGGGGGGGGGLYSCAADSSLLNAGGMRPPALKDLFEMSPCCLIKNKWSTEESTDWFDFKPVFNSYRCLPAVINLNRGLILHVMSCQGSSWQYFKKIFLSLKKKKKENKKHCSLFNLKSMAF